MKNNEIILSIGDTGRRRFLYLSNVDDVRKFVEMYAPVKDFFIGDLSLMSREALSVLLKFLEEKVTNGIECYASRDNLPPVVLSRFNRIMKEPHTTIGTDHFKDFVNKEDTQFDSEVFLATSPSYLDKYLLYSYLPIGVKVRIGDLL